MLFNNFRQNKNDEAVASHLQHFKDQFSEKQKQIIIKSLYTIAQRDGDYHEKEDQFFRETADLLGYQLHEDFDDLLQIDEGEQIAVLNSLNEEQKDWFVVTVVGMVHVDGSAIDEELRYAKELFNKMGITEQRFKEIINNSEAIKESIS